MGSAVTVPAALSNLDETAASQALSFIQAGVKQVPIAEKRVNPPADVPPPREEPREEGSARETSVRKTKEQAPEELIDEANFRMPKSVKQALERASLERKQGGEEISLPRILPWRPLKIGW